MAKDINWPINNNNNNNIQNNQSTNANGKFVDINLHMFTSASFFNDNSMFNGIHYFKAICILVIAIAFLGVCVLRNQHIIVYDIPSPIQVSK